MIRTILRRARDERGASLVEYALLVALIAVVCIGAVTFLGRSGSDKLQGAGNALADRECSEYPAGGGHWVHYFSDDTYTEHDGRCP